MLSNLLKQRLVTAQIHPKGISIDSIPDTKTSNTKNILVIPHGISSSNVKLLKTMKNITIAEGINKDYVNDEKSLVKFYHTIETIKPFLIIAGSRGAELVTDLLKKYPNVYKNRILLFGPVHLCKLFDIIDTNKLTIVHGLKDTNEKIENVRGLVFNRKKNTFLIEDTLKGHKLEFDEQTLNNIIRYTFSS